MQAKCNSGEETWGEFIWQCWCKIKYKMSTVISFITNTHVLTAFKTKILNCNSKLWRLEGTLQQQQRLSWFLPLKPVLCSDSSFCYAALTPKIQLHYVINSEHSNRKSSWLGLTMCKHVPFAVFKELQKESEFQRREWFRKQGKVQSSLLQS